MDELPLAVWTNLPLITCCTFTFFIIIGLIVIIRKNRQIAMELQQIQEETPENEKDA